jgi:ribosomal protein L32E
MIILKLVHLLRKMQTLFEAKLVTISSKVHFMKNETHYTQSHESGINILNA